MSQQGTFDRQSLNLIPDLSLHISPPNSAHSSICTAQNDADSGFNIWQKDDTCGLKSHSDSSIRLVEYSQADTELSLANPSTTSPTTNTTAATTGAAMEAESPWRRAQIEDQATRQRMNCNLLQCGSSGQMSQLNHGISVLDVSGLKPIKGIPVYNNWTNSNPNQDMDPRFCFNPMPYSLPTTSSADHYHHHHNKPSFRQGYRVIGTSSTTAATRSISNGLSMDKIATTVPQFQYHHHQYGGGGVGGADVYSTSGLIRSRFLPKLQSKRNMRAPRMRWTSSLHARFVHAVELLGGHESNSNHSLLSICQFNK